MRRAFKVFALVALMAGIGVADHVMAACNDGLTAFYPINQCGRGTWFAAPPAGSGPVSAAWWQVGFGNAAISDGGGAAGTGFQFGVGFLGNDSGLNTGDPALLDLRSATFVGGPAGSLCFSSASNWALPGIDGCADNPRTGNGPYGYSKDDNILNPYFASGIPGGAGVGLYTRAYLIDAPMAFLLTEGTGKSFALAFAASDSRGGSATSVDPGQFDMQDISNGDLNPGGPSAGRNNVIPWQGVPSPTLSIAFSDPNNTSSPRLVTASWNAVRLVHDGSDRPSPDTTMSTNGVGVLNQGSLVHYDLQTAPIVDAAGTCGTFASAAATDTTGASITVPADTCVRLRTCFGRVPENVTVNGPNAAAGRLGDAGYCVTSGVSKVAGQLAVQKITITGVVAEKNVWKISFTTTSELNASTFQAIGIDGKGGRSTLASTDCSACTSGLGSSYTLEIPRSGVKGAKSVVIVMQPSGDTSNEVPLR